MRYCIVYPLTVIVVATVTVTLLGPGTGADVIEGDATVDPTSLDESPEGTGSVGSCDTAGVVFEGIGISIVAIGTREEEAYPPACVVGETTSLVVSPEGIGNLGSCDTEDTAAVGFTGRGVLMVAVAEETWSPAPVVVGDPTSLVVSPEGIGNLGSCDVEDTAVEAPAGGEVPTAEVTAVGARPVGATLPPPTRDPSSAAFARPILYAASSGVVHPTLVPALRSSGIEKHLVGAVHGDTMIYIPSEPHWAKAPLIQAF